jgi:hypothetical protein
METSKRLGGISRFWASRSRYEKALIVLFLLTLPFVHARVRWDGRGYYAYLRSPLIDHNFQFASDWNTRPDPLFYNCRACGQNAKLYWNNPASDLIYIFLNGHIYVNPITKTGHLPNFYTVGPAILWFPFVAVAHLAVLGADRLGFGIPPDGHSWPYLVALAVATNLYGFLAIYISFQFAREFVEEIWAFWAAVGVWFASSLPVYMYLDPSWSHAHSAFCVSLFLWYWYRTRQSRTWSQWLLLGLLAGLMVDVYLANGIFVLAPAFDCLTAYADAWRFRKAEAGLLWKNLRLHLVFAAGGLIAFSPMIIAREIVYGSPVAVGMYGNVGWNWKSPVFRQILFSADHGIFVWTPIILLAVAGLAALWRLAPRLAQICLLMTLAFYCLIAVYPWWFGTLSYGNRFFVSLTPIFILGLAAGFSRAARFWSSARSASLRLVPLTVALIVWNFGVIYQWTTDMLPTPGVIDWNEVLYNQFRVVPQLVLSQLTSAIGQHFKII